MAHPPIRGQHARKVTTTPRSPVQLPMADIAETQCDYKKARMVARRCLTAGPDIWGPSLFALSVFNIEQHPHPPRSTW